jgi:hypothetical protein
MPPKKRFVELYRESQRCALTGHIFDPNEYLKGLKPEAQAEFEAVTNRFGADARGQEFLGDVWPVEVRIDIIAAGEQNSVSTGDGFRNEPCLLIDRQDDRQATRVNQCLEVSGGHADRMVRKFHTVTLRARCDQNQRTCHSAHRFSVR